MHRVELKYYYELMKVIIVGYGNMGREVEPVIMERNHTLVAKIDPIGGEHPVMTEKLARQADIAIEFSLPQAVIENARLYSRYKLNAVVGTTGWHDQMPLLKEIISLSEIGYIYGSNFSIGAHIFFRIIAHAAHLIESIPQYDLLGFEIHHKQKKDSPSGTARQLADIILKNNQRKKEVVTEKLNRPLNEEELHFSSLRGGYFPGRHTVFLDSAADTIELSHTARNRSGLALGAVLAAEWIHSRKGLFEIDDFIKDILP